MAEINCHHNKQQWLKTCKRIARIYFPARTEPLIVGLVKLARFFAMLRDPDIQDLMTDAGAYGTIAHWISYSRESDIRL